MKYNSSKKVPFGYKDVSESEKTMGVQNIFTSVSDKYDLMNDLMSFSLHRSWKQRAAEIIDLSADTTLVDVGGGTGDVAIKSLNYFHRKNKYSQEPFAGEVYVCDLNEEMLEAGKSTACNKISDPKLLEKLHWQKEDACNLPFNEDFADVVSMSFSLRNITDPLKALEEARRILKPQGKFICLEFSKPRYNILRPFYNIYAHKIIPFIGEYVAGDREAYEYLAESIDRFPLPENVVKMINDAGFKYINYQRLIGEVACIYTAW